MGMNSELGTSVPEQAFDRVDRLKAVFAAIPLGMGLGQLGALLAVASEEGLSVNDLADRIGAPQQTASRYAAQLMGRYQEAGDDKPAIPLVEQRVSLDDPRKRALFLTADGAAVVRVIVEAGWPA